MANQPLYILTDVDVRRATLAGTTRSTIITKLTIPPVKFVTSEHNPGGGVMAVNYVQPRIEALEPAFAVAGLDTDIFRGMGEKDTWTLAGAYRDTKTNRFVASRVIIEGAVTSWEPDETDPKEFHGCNHMFAEVTHFEFILGGIERLYFDADEREARRDGVSLFAGRRAALGA